MYLPVTYSPAKPAGLGDFRKIDAALQESEFYPPPYNTDSPIDLSDVYSIAAAGLGNHRGMGLFDNPTDWTTWGWQEWVTIAAGFYFGSRLLGDIGRGVKTARKTVGRRRAKAKRKDELKQELALL